MQANINSLLKKLLQLDPEVAAEIYELAGNVIQLNLENTATSFTFLIQSDGIELLQQQPDKIHVRITGTPTALLAYIAANRYGQTTTASDLEIVGDINLAQQLTALLKKIEIDWEEQLSVFLGDTLAHKSALFFRDGLQVVKELRNKFELDMGEFLKFEQEVVADEDELEAFNRGVDTVRNDVERLKQRMARLEKQENY